MWGGGGERRQGNGRRGGGGGGGGGGGLAEPAQNWIQTDQSACTVKNPANDYIVALQLFAQEKINMDESHYGTVEQATVRGEG